MYWATTTCITIGMALALATTSSGDVVPDQLLETIEVPAQYSPTVYSVMTLEVGVTYLILADGYQDHDGQDHYADAEWWYNYDDGEWQEYYPWFNDPDRYDLYVNGAAPDWMGSALADPDPVSDDFGSYVEHVQP